MCVYIYTHTCITNSKGVVWAFSGSLWHVFPLVFLCISHQGPANGCFSVVCALPGGVSAVSKPSRTSHP